MLIPNNCRLPTWLVEIAISLLLGKMHTIFISYNKLLKVLCSYLQIASIGYIRYRVWEMAEWVSASCPSVRTGVQIPSTHAEAGTVASICNPTTSVGVGIGGYLDLL